MNTATSLFLALTSVTLAHCFRRYFFVSLLPPFNAFRDSHFNGEHTPLSYSFLRFRMFRMMKLPHRSLPFFRFGCKVL